MKQDFNASPGQSLLYKALPNAEPIRGVVIDNPTGGWLYLVSENQWVPPYTNGWSMPLTYMQTSVNVEYRSVGPAGQISTQQGTTDSPWRLELNSEEVDSDSGGPTSNFIEQFTPVLSSVVLQTVVQAAGISNAVLIAGVANKRIRLLTISVNGGLVGQNDGAFQWVISSSFPFTIFGTIDTMRGVVQHFFNFANGVDMGTGAGVFFSASQQVWQSAIDVEVQLTYQLI